jgi:hypothetical protein
VVSGTEQKNNTSIFLPWMTEKATNAESSFTHPSSQFKSKFVFNCANNVSTFQVVTYNIWTQIEDQYVKMILTSD